MEQIIQNLLQELVRQAVPHVVQAVQHQLGGGMQQAAQPQQNTLGGGLTGGLTATPQQAQQNTGNMFGGMGQQTQQAEQVTPEQLQALITPLIQVEQVKNALLQQMQQVGVNSLPEAKPEQLADLYRRFKEVERQAIQAGLIAAPGGAATTPAGGGII